MEPISLLALAFVLAGSLRKLHHQLYATDQEVAGYGQFNQGETTYPSCRLLY